MVISDENRSNLVRPTAVQGGLNVGTGKLGQQQVRHTRSALRDINERSLVAAQGYPCVVNKRAFPEKPEFYEKKQADPAHRPKETKLPKLPNTSATKTTGFGDCVFIEEECESPEDQADQPKPMFLEQAETVPDEADDTIHNLQPFQSGIKIRVQLLESGSSPFDQVLVQYEKKDTADQIFACTPPPLSKQASATPLTASKKARVVKKALFTSRIQTQKKFKSDATIEKKIDTIRVANTLGKDVSDCDDISLISFKSRTTSSNMKITTEIELETGRATVNLQLTETEEVVVDRQSTQTGSDWSVITEDKCNMENAKLILEEYKEIESKPSPDFECRVLGHNPFEWLFAFKGCRGTEFELGIYHGRILFPKDYPSEPPTLKLLTENGRFEIKTFIGLNWQPSRVRDALLELILLMDTDPHGKLGSVENSKEERRVLAMKARAEGPKYGTTEHQKLIDENHKNMLSKADLLPVPPQPSLVHEHSQNHGAKRKHGTGSGSVGNNNFIGNIFFAANSNGIGVRDSMNGYSGGCESPNPKRRNRSSF